MEENYVSFRKAKVGGFNKKDVISYIEKMRNDFFDYKKAVESTIEQLNAKVRELESACEGQKEQIREVIVEVPVEVVNIADPLSNINEATSQLRLVADELCKNLTDFMSKISYNNCTSTRGQEKTEIFENVSAYIEETAKEIFEETPAESCCDDEEKNASDDRVATILGSSANFSFMKDNSESETSAVDREDNKSVLDCLNGCSFLI